MLLALVVAVPNTLAADEDPFASHVRPTDPLSPEEERAGFQLPPGFVAELVAAEDQIAKPMNLAFDDRGRLWVSCSLEYPYAAPLDAPRAISSRSSKTATAMAPSRRPRPSPMASTSRSDSCPSATA